MASGDHPHSRSGDFRAAISNALVKLWRAQFGRGPTKVRTYVNGNMLICVVQDTLTHAERSLVQSGDTQWVRSTRRRHHDAMRSELASTVSELVGAQVVGVLADDCIEPDYSVQIFILDRNP